MLFAHYHVPNQVVAGGEAIRQADVKAFRARVSLALAAADTVELDLTHTARIDGWGLLALVELSETYAPRLSIAASPELRATLNRVASA